MIKVNTEHLTLSKEYLDSFDRIVELLCNLTQVDYVGVVKDCQPIYEITCNNGFPLKRLNQHQSISTVRAKVIKKIHNRACKAAMEPMQGKEIVNSLGLHYYAYALFWPDGSLYGALLLINDTDDRFDATTQALLHSFKESIESLLGMTYQQASIDNLSSKLLLRNDNRAKNIANLNFTLSQEIDKRKAAEQEVLFLKNHDSGTGFLNQLSLAKQTEELLNKAKNTPEHVAIIHINFSNGRKLQERYGEGALSALLIKYRERLGAIECLESVIARTSISNFVIALRTTTLTPFIDNLCYRCLEVCHSDFEVENDHVHLHGFIGVSTSVDTKTPSDLIYFANEAAFSCKETGQKYSYYSETHTEKRIQTNEIESYLLQAVRNDDLKLYFQPKVDLKSGRWIGAEALIRWNHPVLGSVSNENLMQLAEQNGLIFEVGNFVLRSAIEMASDWHATRNEIKIAVNISSVQLKNADFINQLEHLLELYQFPANLLEIELTESCLISDEYLAKQTLKRLRDIGVTLSLDDFGTGCSSFSYLKNYPFTSLKIDKSFVQNVTDNNSDKEIIHSIVQIAKKLDLEVTIEGVENLDQERFVLNEGCDFAQGYLYGKPMTGEEFKLCITP
jgi:EAL domain-containing protein (putative c-di-GMP-specific phosphodiesterase class I)/GGDEF domain-containing protein